MQSTRATFFSVRDNPNGSKEGPHFTRSNSEQAPQNSSLGSCLFKRSVERVAVPQDLKKKEKKIANKRRAPHACHSIITPCTAPRRHTQQSPHTHVTTTNRTAGTTVLMALSTVCQLDRCGIACGRVSLGAASLVTITIIYIIIELYIYIYHYTIWSTTIRLLRALLLFIVEYTIMVTLSGYRISCFSATFL